MASTLVTLETHGLLLLTSLLMVSWGEGISFVTRPPSPIFFTNFSFFPLPPSPSPSLPLTGGRVAVSPDGKTIVWAPMNKVPHYSTNNGTTWTPSTGASDIIVNRTNVSSHLFSSFLFSSPLLLILMYFPFSYEVMKYLLMSTIDI